MGSLFAEWGTLALILAGALAGGFVNGLTGFGTGLTALPLWLQAVEPVVAAQLVSAASVIGHVSTLPAIWHAIDWRRLAPMLIAGLIGVTILTAMLVASLVQGLIGLRLLAALVVALPGTLIGARLGSLVYRRLGDRRFDRIVLVLLLVSGLGLVWSSR